MVTAILALSSVMFFGLAANGFQSGVMYGQAADVARQRNPRAFRLVGLTYCVMGVIFLIGAVLTTRA